MLGALIGGVYCTACLTSTFAFLGSSLWYVVYLIVVCLCSFGLQRQTWRGAGLYCVLKMTVDGLTKADTQMQTLLWATALCGLFLISIYRNRPKQFLPVELCCGEKKARLQGLVDTGHSLRDPVSGLQVLIVGADVAQVLTGLSPQQLADPVKSIGKLPGLRLIPYKTVGKPQGMLLAMQLKNGRIGNQKGSVLVAFAPQVLDEAGKFQALIGGNI